MRVLVIGGTGTVGGYAVKDVLARGHVPLVLVRSERAVPAGAQAIAGDTLDSAAVEGAVRQADRVIFVTPHETLARELQMTRNVLDACANRGVPVTYFGVGLPGTARWTRRLFGWLVGFFMPHYRERFTALHAAFDHPVRAHIIGAGCFCQCTDFFLDDIRAGTFTEPTGTLGMNRVDAQDIGAALAATATLPTDAARVVMGVEGAQVVTGPQAAALWSAALGRPVQYVGHTSDQWRASLARHMSGEKLDQYLKTLALMPKAWVPVSKARLRITEALIGRPARSYADYVRDTAARMLAEERAHTEVRADQGVAA